MPRGGKVNKKGRRRMLPQNEDDIKLREERELGSEEEGEGEDKEDEDDADWETQADDRRLAEESERARAAFAGMKVEENSVKNERLNVRELVGTVNPNANPKAVEAARVGLPLPSDDEDEDEAGGTVLSDPYGAFDPSSRSTMSKAEKEEMEKKKEEREKDLQWKYQTTKEAQEEAEKLEEIRARREQGAALREERLEEQEKKKKAAQERAAALLAKKQQPGKKGKKGKKKH